METTNYSILGFRVEALGPGDDDFRAQSLRGLDIALS